MTNNKPYSEELEVSSLDIDKFTNDLNKIFKDRMDKKIHITHFYYSATTQKLELIGIEEVSEG